MDIGKELEKAHAYQKAGNLKQAAEIYLQVLQNQPDNLDVAFMLGLISARLGSHDQAIKYFGEAIRIDPSYADAHYNLANVFRDRRQYHEALSSYKKVLQIIPDHAETYVSMGFIFRIQGRLDEEVRCYRKAIQMNPSLAGAYYNLGHALADRGQLDEAIECYRKVIQISPDFLHAYSVLGLLLRIRGRNAEAENCYRSMIQLHPDNPEAHWDLSNVLLLSGNYREGWREFEWFRKKKDCMARQRSFMQPLWEGSEIKGKRILLHAEEGFGDTIQFVRYAPLVARMGAVVIVECQKELTPLVQEMDGIETALSYGDTLPSFDLHCPLMSLPRVFDTVLETIPATVPYLRANAGTVEHWGRRISHDPSYVKIGLAWAGGGLPFKKSCPLDELMPLTQRDDVTLYSLQKGSASAQAKNPPGGMRLTDLTEDIRNFVDTAALIENLDLIISVDTSVAHLAGAVAKPVWVLLPYVPDWRWLLEREDSPWYPTMRLFRQPSLGDWKSVIMNVRSEMEKFTKSV
jgi:tetratricopeptide (TPR) repeat protein